MRTASVVAIIFAVGMCVAPVHATVLFYEGFDYTAGSGIEGQGPWSVGAYVGPNPAGSVVANSGLTYQNLVVTGLALDPESSNLTGALAAGTELVFDTNGTYYWTFLVQGNAQISLGLRNWSLPYLFGIRRADDFAGVETDVVATNGAAPGTFSDTDVNLVAIRIINNAGIDEMNLVVNPDISSGAEPNWAGGLTVNDEFTSAVTDNVVMYMSVVTGTHLIDEIRIATTWAEAAPIPEPTGFLLLAIGGVAGLSRFRRRRSA